MALGDLSLSVSEGVSGREFRSKLLGTTAGSTLEVREVNAQGFGALNGFLVNPLLAYEGNTVEVIERVPGETHTTRLTIDTYSADDIRAAEVEANEGVTRQDVGLYAARTEDGSTRWYTKRRSATGAVTTGPISDLFQTGLSEETLASAALILETEPLADISTVMSSPPTITTQSGASTLSGAGITFGAGQFQPGDPAHFTPVGSYLDVSSNYYQFRNGQTSNFTTGALKSSNGGMAFRTDAPAVDILLNNSTGAKPWIVSVVDEGTGVRGRISSADLTTGGTNQYNKLTFSGAGARTYYFFSASSPNHSPMRSVNCTTGYTIEPVTLPASPSIGFMGDSHVDGQISDTATVSVRLAYPHWFAAEFGSDKVWSQGQGGTGFLNNGNGGGTYAQRQASGDLARMGAQDMLVLPNTTNDGVALNAAFTDEALFDAIIDLVRRAMRDQPTAWIIVPGPMNMTLSPTATPQVIPQERYDAIQAAVEEAADGDPRVIYIDNSPAGDPWVTDANKGTVIGADGTHLTLAGAKYIGQKFAAQVRTAIANRLARIVPVDEDLSYVVRAHPDYGAIAFKMERNTGGSGYPNLGAPHETWRQTGVYAMDSITDDPATDGTVIGADNGAWDYAFQISSIPEYGGSWHGGETLQSYRGADLTQEGYVQAFTMDQRSTIDFSNGVQVAISRQYTIGVGGVVTEAISASSEGVVSTRTLGMLILDSAFDQYSVDGGDNYTSIPNDDSIVDLGDPTDLLLRNPVNGFTVRQVTNAPSQDQYTRISARRQSRTKTYNEFDTEGVVGTIGMERTVTFGLTEPDPVPEWEPYTIDFTEATPGNANLPLYVTREGGGTAPTTLTTTGGGSLTIGGGSGTNRWVITDPAKVLPPGDYVVTFNYTTSTSNNTGRSQVSGVSTGSIVTDQISAGQSFNAPSGGSNVHTFTVAAGKTGYIAWESTTNTDGRTVTLTSIVVTGTPA